MESQQPSVEEPASPRTTEPIPFSEEATWSPLSAPEEEEEEPQPPSPFTDEDLPPIDVLVRDIDQQPGKI